MELPSTARNKRRVTEKSPADRFQILKDLKKTGQKHGSIYKVKEEDDIYDEVDENYSRTTHKGNIEDDDFIVDDDGNGYVDNGQESSDQNDSDSAQEDIGTKGKRKRGSKSSIIASKLKPAEKIQKFFRTSEVKSTPKPLATSTGEADFMASILSGLDNEAPMMEATKHKIIEPIITYEPNVDGNFNENAISEPDVVQLPVKEESCYENNCALLGGGDLKVKPLQIRNRDIGEQVDIYNLAVKPRGVSVKPSFKEVTSSGWEAVQAISPAINPVSSAPPRISGPIDSLESDGSLRMWWFDAYEQKEHGTIFLFGKVLNKVTQSYISCCVSVSQLERNIFVLPRPRRFKEGHETDEEVLLADVFKEIESIRSKHMISKWMVKEVTRKYAFEIAGVPQESNYLKIVYQYNQPMLPMNLQGETFSHIFGTNTSCLELFIIKKKMMGPCWLEIKNAEIVHKNMSWCKLEVLCKDPKLINPFREGDGNAPTIIPPLVMMSLNMKTVMNHQKHVQEIVVASALVFSSVRIDDTLENQQLNKQSFTVVRQLEDQLYPQGFNEILKANRSKVELTLNERQLLNYLIAAINQTDPDFIVGHNFIGFHLDVLFQRMKVHKIENWSSIGRLRRTIWPKLQLGPGGDGETTMAEKQAVSGRLMCDTFLSAKEYVKSKAHTLTELAKSQLGINRDEIDADKIPICYNTAMELRQLITLCEIDAYLALQLMFNLQVLPLTKQLTNLAGNLWSRTLAGARAERNEFLLLHEFHRNKFICPDKVFNPKVANVIRNDNDNDNDEIFEVKKGRRKPTYTGGLVLEPKKGLYDKFVITLDFNSLYPSIIQEYNICFTTVERTDADDQIPDIPDNSLSQGILPKIIKNLVEKRRLVKSLMKNPKLTAAELVQYDIRQKALKLTANSMYGSLGLSSFRFHCKPIAALITSKGREILINTKDLVEGNNLNVIYGDTDSIMVYTNETDAEKAKQIGNEIKKKVNERYRLLEIDIDALSKRMLLLRKKKYAALVLEERDGRVNYKMDVKGLDLVRRDWCQLTFDVSDKVLNMLLSDMDREEVTEIMHNYLTEIAQETRSGLISIEKFIINKTLSKNPEEYADTKSQPHVHVALQLKKRGISIRIGDTVPYIICSVDGSVNIGFAERARHPDDIKRGESNIKIDFEYYLQNQIHAPVTRLCEVVDGTDSARIAHCLGLDPSKFRHASSTIAGEEFQPLHSQISDAERFKDVDKLHIRCCRCMESFVFTGLVRSADSQVSPSLQCPNLTCSQICTVSSIRVQLLITIRDHIQRYYDSWLICDDPSCRNRTRMMSVYAKRCLSHGCQGTMTLEYSDTALYNQLNYYSSLFDIDKAMRKTPDLISALVYQQRPDFDELKKVVEKYLNRSGRKFVDMSRLFSFCKI